MFGIHDFSIFLTTAIILNITPGSDTFYIVGRTLAQGRSSGLASVLGISTGSLCHTILAALGLSTLVLTSSWAFLAIKLIGAAYLIFLGVKMLLTRKTNNEVNTNFKSSDFFSIYKQGLLTNVLNPKVALFFLALVPQFISDQTPSKFLSFIILGITFVITGTIWCVFIVCISASCKNLFKESKHSTRWLNRITGGLFITLGIKTATTD